VKVARTWEHDETTEELLGDVEQALRDAQLDFDAGETKVTVVQDRYASERDGYVQSLRLRVGGRTFYLELWEETR
jgi:hypothetical protein